MKKYLMIALAVLISVAFVTTVFAQGPTDTAGSTEKSVKKVEKKVAPKAKTPQYTGEVTAMDATAKTLTVKGKTDEKTFDVANVKMKKEPKAGDKVTVKYAEKDGKMVAKSVTIEKSAKKAPAPKKEEVKPAPAPAPAAAPAPAPAK
jgi:hypothetical protein